MEMKLRHLELDIKSNNGKIQIDNSENAILAEKLQSKHNEVTNKRIGRDYQAICPDLIPQAERHLDNISERALTVWAPSDKLKDDEIEQFITLAMQNYGYNTEQALGMLLWHEHDVMKAKLDLARFKPYGIEWTPEDMKMFKDALRFHGKNFVRISALVPNKQVADVIHFYYASKQCGRRKRRLRNN